MVREGAPEGVLLTGLASADFISLIQHYVDSTGDVQTAAIVGLHACHLTSSASRSSVTSTSGGRRGEHTLTRQTSGPLEEDKQQGRSGPGSSRPTVADRDVPVLVKLGGGIRLTHWVQW